jgi:hypothetical protein
MQILLTDHEPPQQVALAVPVKPVRQLEVQVVPWATGRAQAKGTTFEAAAG